MSRKRTQSPAEEVTADPMVDDAADPAETGPDYDVGYGRPPKHTRFRKGQSGNLRGRPKGRLNATEALNRELDQMITVREGGKTIRMTKREAMIKRLAADAMAGKKYAVDAILAHERTRAEASGTAVNFTSEDAAIVENFLARVGAQQPLGGDHGA